MPARSQPSHLAPQPKAPNSSPRGGLDGVIDSLLFAQHAIEMLGRSRPNGAPKHRLDQLANRLTQILAENLQTQPGRLAGRDWPSSVDRTPAAIEIDNFAAGLNDIDPTLIALLTTLDPMRLTARLTSDRFKTKLLI
jgi:hypothetical protein